MLNRRRFIYGVFSAGLLGPSFTARASAAQGTQRPTLAGPLSRDMFLALRQQPFTAVLGNRRVQLVLVRVDDDGCDASGEQFTVVFEGPRDLPLHEGACVLRHRTAGAAELYLQTSGLDGRSRYYKAPFNLLA